MTKTLERYGWQPDLPDHRDFLFRPTVAHQPSSADVRNQTSVPVDQGQLGSCTGNSCGSMVFSVEFIEKPYGNAALPSRLGLYWGGRSLEGTVKQDAGAQIRDILKVLANTGAADEKLWPYVIAKFARKPPVKYFREAAKHRAITYHRLNNANLNELKSCLVEGYPFVFGFTVYETFESDGVAQSGIVPMPSKDEKALGGHAVLCVGYDDASGRFLVQNSWGTSFGMNGFFTIPYEYLTNTNLADDFWTLRTIG